LGIVRSLLPPHHEFQGVLHTIQRELMVVMSHVATPAAIRHENPNRIPDDMTIRCEQEIDRLKELLRDNDYFVLPGGTLPSAQLQFARTVARRAERRLWTLNRQDELPGEILRFMNRLSDLLFVMARYEMQQQNLPEERWQAFAYKRKSKT
jgi:ATP:cob(I)alamin adenosyltransferase